jgi:hypothetical protein
MILGPFWVGFLNKTLDDQFQSEWVNLSPEQSALLPRSPRSCVPIIDSPAYAALEQLFVTKHDDISVSIRMASLMFADQAVRQIPIGFDPQKVNEKDTLRRIEVLELIKNGEIHSGRNLVYAAFIFQHGDCSEHYQFANRLAQIAMEVGYTDAKWIFAASQDRYLISIGKPQKYGTQYFWIEGEYQLYSVDPTTTDEERAKYNVPALEVAINHKPEGKGNDVFRKKWLETWWMTLIGAGFAALGAIIGIVDEKPNAMHGWTVVIISVLLLLISFAGHYAQIKALSQGIIETQRNIWSTVNILMIIVWIVFVVFEGIRLVSKNSASP